MTPADEAIFIVLWNQGLETTEIGRQLGIPRGTVASRAKRLPELREIINRFSALEARVAALEDGTRTPPHPHTCPTRGSTSSSGPCGSPRP